MNIGYSLKTDHLPSDVSKESSPTKIGLQVSKLAKMRLSTSEVTSLLTRISLQASVLRNSQTARATAQKVPPPPEAETLASLQLFPDFPPTGHRDAGSTLRSAQSLDLDSTAAAISRTIAEKRLNVSISILGKQRKAQFLCWIGLDLLLFTLFILWDTPLECLM